MRPLPHHDTIEEDGTLNQVPYADLTSSNRSG
jgi:hypothetical protein